MPYTLYILELCVHNVKECNQDCRSLTPQLKIGGDRNLIHLHLSLIP
jgi:hypothetical protein